MNKTALDQYEEIVTDALKSCSVKLRKSFKTAFIQLMILYMVLPRKINFVSTQFRAYPFNRHFCKCLYIELLKFHLDY